MSRYGDPGHERWLIEQEQEDERWSQVAQQEIMAEIGRRETEGLDWVDDPAADGPDPNDPVAGYVARLRDAAGPSRDDYLAYGQQGADAYYADLNGGAYEDLDEDGAPF